MMQTPHIFLNRLKELSISCSCVNLSLSETNLRGSNTHSLIPMVVNERDSWICYDGSSDLPRFVLFSFTLHTNILFCWWPCTAHYDVISCKGFPYYQPVARTIHRWEVYPNMSNNRIQCWKCRKTYLNLNLFLTKYPKSRAVTFTLLLVSWTDSGVSGQLWGHGDPWSIKKLLMRSLIDVILAFISVACRAIFSYYSRWNCIFVIQT